MERPSGRASDALRNVTLEQGFSLHAEGSCLAKFGNTHVLCTASVEDRVPSFLRNTGRGWVTAEYGMLPRSTHTRTDREASRGKQGGRTLEIQRLIGRALRSVTDLEALGEHELLLGAQDRKLLDLGQVAVEAGLTAERGDRRRDVAAACHDHFSLHLGRTCPKAVPPGIIR